MILELWKRSIENTLLITSEGPPLLLFQPAHMSMTPPTYLSAALLVVYRNVSETPKLEMHSVFCIDKIITQMLCFGFCLLL